MIIAILSIFALWILGVAFMVALCVAAGRADRKIEVAMTIQRMEEQFKEDRWPTNTG